MKTYQLLVVTPNGKVFDGQIKSLKAPGILGSFGVLAGHAPMVSILEKGVLTVEQDGNEHFYALKTGVLEVGEKNNVLLLTDEIISGDNKNDAEAKLQALK